MALQTCELSFCFIGLHNYRYRNNISKFELQFIHGMHLVIMHDLFAVMTDMYCILSKPCIPAAGHCVVTHVAHKQDVLVEQSLNQFAW